MTCTIAVSEETFESLADLVPDVSGRSGRFTFVDRPEWLGAWWDEYSADSELKLLSVRDESGKAALIAPLQVTNGTAAFLGGTDLFDYHDFICPDGAADEKPVHVDAVIRQLTGDPAIERLEFLSLPEDSTAYEYLPDVCEAAGWVISLEKEDVAPRLSLPGTWDDYVSGLSRKNRHELRRKMRRLEGAGELRHFEVGDPAAISEGLEDFFDLHKKSTPDKAQFMTPDRERFFRRAALSLAEEGITRLSFVELNGVRIASSLSFVCCGTKYLYNSGYDPSYGRLAAGLLNHAYNIRRSIEAGLSVFDFMRGDETYKYHLGGEDRLVYRLTAIRRPAGAQ